MLPSKYEILSVLSGCVWAGIAYLLGHKWMPPFLWGGIIASPFIGLFIGKISRPMYKRSGAVRFSWVLLTFYLAVVLFGLAAGIADVLRFIPNRIPGAVITQTIIGTISGATAYILILLPLACLNHLALYRFDKKG